ncbi:ATPase [Kocuria sp. CNJ-770]|uniref:N-acetylglucosamine kinase n=1 Tax=Kocuria sp. CNJ-770 TaxID=1904964 RepID=UPI00096974C6|nr:BadF/BadG/BcrA/BcrD ATPase family protein [Kocuria sp. CNJ-770]OLT04745.1 ATPase [Kocuria sp. CNJ-770]
MSILIGLDIGGTKTHGLRAEGGTVAQEAFGGSANVQNVSRDAAASVLAQVLAELGAADADVVVAGAGGVDTAADAEALRGLIAPHAGRARVVVVHDTRLVLAAGGCRTGIAVIAGTGSAAWGTAPGGREARAGGWGHLLGDEGSGYWMGRELVRRALARHDDGQAPDALDRAVLDRCGLAQPGGLIERFHTLPERGLWAGLSRVAFEAAAQDEDAMRLVDRTADALAELAATVSRRLALSGPVVVGGGLAVHQPLLRERLREAAARRGLGEVRVLDRAPVHGTLRLADQP